MFVWNVQQLLSFVLKMHRHINNLSMQLFDLEIYFCIEDMNIQNF
jgi:hypothetical protein